MTVSGERKGPSRAPWQGIRNCREVGLKVGLRFTINRLNQEEVPGIFDLLERENIPRICFYHLVYAGRGSNLVEQDLDHEETRRVVDLIMDRTRDLHDRGLRKRCSPWTTMRTAPICISE